MRLGTTGKGEVQQAAGWGQGGGHVLLVQVLWCVLIGSCASCACLPAAPPAISKPTLMELEKHVGWPSPYSPCVHMPALQAGHSYIQPNFMPCIPASSIAHLSININSHPRPHSGWAAFRRKNEPLDFVALLAEEEQPVIEKLGAKRGAGGASKRSKAPAKTLLPEDHHYKVGGGGREYVECVCGPGVPFLRLFLRWG